MNSAGSDGLLYGNPELIVHQVAGVATAIILGVVGTLIILKIVRLFVPLRVTQEEELMGLDISLHEERAYSSTVLPLEIPDDSLVSKIVLD